MGKYQPNLCNLLLSLWLLLRQSLKLPLHPKWQHLSNKWLPSNQFPRKLSKRHRCSKLRCKLKLMSLSLKRRPKLP